MKGPWPDLYRPTIEMNLAVVQLEKIDRSPENPFLCPWAPERRKAAQIPLKAKRTEAPVITVFFRTYCCY